LHGPTLWNVQKRTICRHTKQINGCQSWGGGDGQVSVDGTQMFWSNENILKVDSDDSGTTLNMLKPTALYTLEWQILWHANYNMEF
jgi:hypothetical protein